MLGEAITRRHVVTALVGVLAVDALFNVVPNSWMEADLNHLQVPRGFRYLFGSVKAASAAGLLIGVKRPRLGRLTAWLLVAYFVLALLAHARIGDRPIRYAPALGMLAWAVAAGRCFPHGAGLQFTCSWELRELQRSA